VEAAARATAVGHLRGRSGHGAQHTQLHLPHERGYTIDYYDRTFDLRPALTARRAATGGSAAS
jgi:hypothetical protein